MKSSTLFFFKVQFKALILILGLLSFCACQKKIKPSFIVIAVDRLSFNSFSCNDERNLNKSGLAVLCQESIRYSNAYTTSTQPAAALASLLTGTYPYQHGLHRSNDRINPRLPQVQELFKKNNYRTSFFSGSPTVFKKTGLYREFDVFDDSSFLNQTNFSTPFVEQIKIFKSWIEESNEPFFSVIYNSDLEMLSDVESNSNKIDNFDEQLGNLITEFKKSGRWENNFVILVGLQGRSDYNRLSETSFSNIHSENMNISFFIKPPRQKGDEGINLKIDSVVSLADFGLSLIKIIEPNFNHISNEVYPISDLSNLWISNQLSTTNNSSSVSQRKIVLESVDTWSTSLKLRLGLIFGNYIYLENEKNSLYNRLNDGLETIDLVKTYPDIANESQNSLDRLHQQISAEKWVNFTGPISHLVDLNRQYWVNANQREKIFEAEKLRLTKEKTTHPLSTLLIYYQNIKKEKDSLFEEARRNSYNLSMENLWGIWNSSKKWPQPLAQPAVTKENQ